MLKKIKNIYLKLMKKDLTKIEEKVEILTRRSEKMAKKARGDSMAFLFAIFMRDFRSIHVIYIATKARKKLCIRAIQDPRDPRGRSLICGLSPEIMRHIFYSLWYTWWWHFLLSCVTLAFVTFFFLNLRGRQHGHPRIITEISRINQRFLLFLYLFLGYPIERGKSYPFCKSNPSPFLT